MFRAAALRRRQAAPVQHRNDPTRLRQYLPHPTGQLQPGPRACARDGPSSAPHPASTAPCAHTPRPAWAPARPCAIAHMDSRTGGTGRARPDAGPARPRPGLTVRTQPASHPRQRRPQPAGHHHHQQQQRQQRQRQTANVRQPTRPAGRRASSPPPTASRDTAHRTDPPQPRAPGPAPWCNRSRRTTERGAQGPLPHTRPQQIMAPRHGPDRWGIRPRCTDREPAGPTPGALHALLQTVQELLRQRPAGRGPGDPGGRAAAVRGQRVCTAPPRLTPPRGTAAHPPFDPHAEAAVTSAGTPRRRPPPSPPGPHPAAAVLYVYAGRHQVVPGPAARRAEDESRAYAQEHGLTVTEARWPASTANRTLPAARDGSRRGAWRRPARPPSSTLCAGPPASPPKTPAPRGTARPGGPGTTACECAPPGPRRPHPTPKDRGNGPGPHPSRCFALRGGTLAAGRPAVGRKRSTR